MKINNFYTIGIAATLALGTAFTSCEDDEDYSISQNAVISTLTTGGATPSCVSASLSGTVSGLNQLAASRYQVGFIFGTSEDVTVSGTKVSGSVDAEGNITGTLSDLTEDKTYYYAAYVTLQGIVTQFGEVKSFVTTDAAIATAEATGISSCKATLNGQLYNTDGAADATAAGFRYALSEAEVADGFDVAVEATAGSYSAQIAGLLPGTTYYYMAYSNIGPNALTGSVKSFTTAAQSMEYVDLGLSTLWAKYNVGAESEEEAGAKAGFGDQTFMLRSTSVDDYTPWDIAGTDEDNLALLSLDGESPMKSHTPTEAQFKELLEKTTQTQETVNGVEGIRFTASNGNSIFLPMAGLREGDVEDEHTAGFYWTGNVSTLNETYAKSLSVSASGAEIGVSSRHLALSVRPVRDYAVLYPDSAKLVIGDLENNGRIRIEIYNQYGNTSSNPPIAPSSIKFNQNMVVTFTISGIDGNLKDGAPASFTAGLEYAADNWAPSYWSGLTMGKYEAPVTGDGTYVVWCEGEGASGAVVFTIDIDQLGANLVDPSLIRATVNSIKLDASISVAPDACKNFYANDSGEGGRIQIYNPWNGLSTDGYYDDGKMNYTGMQIVTFSISGIDGNLKDGAPTSFNACLSYADKNWGNDYWGGNDWGNATVTGDGTYTTYTYTRGHAQGAVFWCVELANLYASLVDPAKVQVSIDSITLPGRE
ncbi:MAG: hypothetical protein K6E73_02430 [Bacteroidales bacterium]|nr:hypothetical protein [Bacteroidales bacterium]